MNTKFGISGIVAALILGGCSTPVQEIGDNAPSIVLKEPQTRHVDGTVASVSVPAGIYTPDFSANDGVYYHTTGHLIVKAIGITMLQRGGIFIPNPPTEAQLEEMQQEKAEYEKLKAQGVRNLTPPATGENFLQGVWYDQQEGSGGLIVYAATSPKRIFRVEEPFVFEVQTNSQ